MDKQEKSIVIGCGALILISLFLFVWSAQNAVIDAAKGRTIFIVWLCVTVIGGALLVGLQLLRIRQGFQAADAGQEWLAERAEMLREEREKKRRQAEEESASEATAEGRSISFAELQEHVREPAEANVRPRTPDGLRIRVAEGDLGQCPVCQNTIRAGEPYVTCPACNTVHHPDCWEYNDGCAVYGCHRKVPTE